MKHQSHDRYATRESLLELLSDDETAKVSKAVLEATWSSLMKRMTSSHDL